MRIEPITVHNSFAQVYVQYLAAMLLLTIVMDREARWSRFVIKMPRLLTPGLDGGHCTSNVKRMR